MMSDDEVRAKALEIKTAYQARLVAACIARGRGVNSELYDDELDVMVLYIKTGIKPMRSKV